jgi:hypothetical protein
MSWSRITLRSLELSVYCMLPIYRRYSSSTFPHFLALLSHRSCRPERYEIRHAIHAHLVSHTMTVDQFVSHPADSVFRQKSPLPVVAQELRTLIQLFDEILQEDYCDDHESLESLDFQQRPLTCSFCGSCLFLSCFVCHGCSQGRSVPVILCAGCYVEGRSCHCDDMSPTRLGDFPNALQDRNNAIGSLSKASDLHDIPTEGLVEVTQR